MKSFVQYYKDFVDSNKVLKDIVSKNKSKKFQIVPWEGVQPWNESVTLTQLNQKKYFSDITKNYYKAGQYDPTKVKIRPKNLPKKIKKLTFITPSFSGEDKKYRQVVQFETPGSTILELKKSKVKLHCTCPSFNKQGIQYKLSTIDGSIHKEDIPDVNWGPRHSNKNYLCKHLKGIVKNFETIFRSNYEL